MAIHLRAAAKRCPGYDTPGHRLAVTLSKSLALHAMERYEEALDQFDAALELRSGFALAQDRSFLLELGATAD